MDHTPLRIALISEHASPPAALGGFDAVGQNADLQFRLMAQIGPVGALQHVVELLLTSAVIPFLSVCWRVRGAIRFRVLLL